MLQPQAVNPIFVRFVGSARRGRGAPDDVHRLEAAGAS
jgi:hypothetical protein